MASRAGAALLVVCIASLICIHTTYAEEVDESDVVVITEKNWDAKIKKSSFALVRAVPKDSLMHAYTMQALQRGHGALVDAVRGGAVGQFVQRRGTTCSCCMACAATSLPAAKQGPAHTSHT
jgi:hypothetical protein